MNPHEPDRAADRLTDGREVEELRADLTRAWGHAEALGLQAEEARLALARSNERSADLERELEQATRQLELVRHEAAQRALQLAAAQRAGSAEALARLHEERDAALASVTAADAENEHLRARVGELEEAVARALRERETASCQAAHLARELHETIALLGGRGLGGGNVPTEDLFDGAPSPRDALEVGPTTTTGVRVRPSAPYSIRSDRVDEVSVVASRKVRRR